MINVDCTISYGLLTGVGYRIRNCFLTVLQPDGTDDYLPWSIINTLYCCVVFGLMALIFSFKSKSAREQGK